MKRAAFSALLVCSLGLACSGKDDDPGNQPTNMAGSGAVPSAGSSGAAGQPGGQSDGGNADDSGGSVNGGAAGSVNGGAAGSMIGGAAGSVNGGAAGHAGMSSGGSGNSGAGGQTVWPNWVDSCLASQAEKCGGSREYLVCIYGTDEEIASTMVSCSEPVRNYKDYCKCNVSGCGRDCRPAYQ